MLRKISLLFFALAFLPMFLFAQNRVVLRPNGQVIKIQSGMEIQDAANLAGVKPSGKFVTRAELNAPVYNPNGTLDTLQYKKLFPASGNSNFGLNGQDVFLQWFVAPADLTIKSVGFECSDGALGTQASVSIWKLDPFYTPAKLSNLGDVNIGYFPAAGNGYNNVTALQQEATGAWHAVKAGYPDPLVDSIWSDGGYGAPIVPYYGDAYAYQWIPMTTGGLTEPTVKAGEVFAVVMKDDGTQGSNVSSTADRIGVLAAGIDANLGLTANGWKFYQYPRTAGDQTTVGWWIRAYVWDFAVAVDVTGDLAPKVDGMTTLNTTLSTADRTVTATITDTNPGGGPAGVASALLQYSTDGTTYTDVTMTKAGDVYTGVIPGQQPGTTVRYKIKATDVGQLVTTTAVKSYLIYKPTAGVNTLVVFNSSVFTKTTGYPQAYYFGAGLDATGNPVYWNFKHDTWAYGAVTAELLNNYDNLVEITQSSVKNINNTVVKAWLAGKGTRNYLLTGDEYLGSITNWTDSTYAAGTFQYDVLGIAADHNDISYKASGDEKKASIMKPVSGSLLGDSTFKAVALNMTDTLLYNPTYELGSTYSNWLDGVEPAPGVIVDFKAIGISGTEYNVGIHHTMPAGNKVAFLAFDPLSLDAAPWSTQKYIWYGFETTAPQVQALRWFGVTTGVKDEVAGTPNKYNLAQNYPNPFNPSTLISYTLAERSNVSIKVFDMLGREVASLVNEVKSAGNHEVSFNASNLSSGMYVYTITAGNFTTSKKMMLLK